MKTRYQIFVFCLFLSSYSAAQMPDFYAIPTHTLDVLKLYPRDYSFLDTWDLDSVFIWENPPFQISRQVTLKEYKIYLEEIRKDSFTAFYLSQLPDSSICSPKDYGEYLINPKYEKFPVVGVSWQNAFNYARWLTLKENKNGKSKYYYRLPQASEWLVAKYHLDRQKIKHDFDKTLADWGTEAFYENMPYGFNCCRHPSENMNCIIFFAEDDDPIVWKRKAIIGNSFKYIMKRREQNHEFWQFQYTGSSHIGFRLLRENIKDSSELTKCLLEFWEENPSFYRNRTHDYVNNKQANTLIIPVEKNIQRISETLDLKEGRTKVICERKEGRFDGLYQSYYYNGKIKAKGYYNNNQRVGEWAIWDSSGNLVSKRYYENGLTYKRTFPKANNELEAFLLEEPGLTLYKDKNGAYVLPAIHERDIWFERRVLRVLPKEENPLLFNTEKPLVLDLLKEIAEGRIVVYEDMEDRTLIDFDSISSVCKSAAACVGYKIMEVLFLDKKYLVGDSRILKICPLFKDEISGDTLEGFWLYYPEIRPFLQQQKINKNAASHIENLDDLFNFRYFAYNFTAHASVYEFKEKDSLLHDLELIELEYNFWLYFFGKN